jgi:hypothetical protein
MRYSQNTYSDTFLATIGVDFKLKSACRKTGKKLNYRYEILQARQDKNDFVQSQLRITVVHMVYWSCMILLIMKVLNTQRHGFGRLIDMVVDVDNLFPFERC